MSEEVMELDIEEEPEEEEEEAEGGAPEGGAAVSAGQGLTVSLENPKISVDKLIIRKQE